MSVGHWFKHLGKKIKRATQGTLAVLGMTVHVDKSIDDDDGE